MCTSYYNFFSKLKFKFVNMTVTDPTLVVPWRANFGHERQHHKHSGFRALVNALFTRANIPMNCIPDLAKKLVTQNRPDTNSWTYRRMVVGQLSPDLLPLRINWQFSSILVHLCHFWQPLSRPHYSSLKQWSLSYFQRRFPNRKTCGRMSLTPSMCASKQTTRNILHYIALWG